MRGFARRRWLWGIVALAAIPLGGCAFGDGRGGLRSSGVEVTSILPEEGKAATARGYLERLTRLSPEAAREALPRAFADAQEAGSPEARLWAGLLAVRAGAAGSSEVARALALVDDDATPETEARDDAWAGLLALVRSALTGRLEALQELDRIRAALGVSQARAEAAFRTLDQLETQQTAARQDVHAEARGKLEEARRTIDSLRAELEEERKKAAALQGQLEQLKTIEKIMDRREEPKVKGSPP